MALYTLEYNFVKMHETPRMAPTMASGVSDKLWSVADLTEMVDAKLLKAGNVDHTEEKLRAALRDEQREQQLVQQFFGNTPGFFVEVGANHPINGSQSWHLEKRGWEGVLIEPHPQLAAALRKARRARVYDVACSSPAKRGLNLPFHLAGAMSTLTLDQMAPGTQPEATICVPNRTLDDVLAEANAPAPIDFLSVDVEGHEIDVLRGFDIWRWNPRLILLEDHVGTLSKHRYMLSRGYRLARRTGYNGWYVPPNCPVTFEFRDRWEVFRKYYLALPFRILRNASRKIRQPIKDGIRARRQRNSN